MAIKVGNKTFRNMPEQVAKNKADILELKDVFGEIGDYGEMKTYVDTIKDLIVENTNTNTTEIGNNVEIDGNLAVNSGITADSIIENMGAEYTFTASASTDIAVAYAGVVKTGNKITFVISGTFTPTQVYNAGETRVMGTFTMPEAVGQKLIANVGTNRIGYKAFKLCIDAYQGIQCNSFFTKNDDTSGYFSFGLSEQNTANTTYYFRFEETFLLSDSLAS